MSVLTELELEIRSGEGFQVADVNWAKRLVTVVAMPYERPAEVGYRGRLISEVVSRGAFDGVERRAGRIRVNRDHSWERPVGKVVALHPSRVEGLVTEVKIAATTLGEETLALCDDGVLDASAGFALLRRDDGRVWEDAEAWEANRTVRRLNRLRLDHVALVPNPAYDDAVVLDVRHGREGTQEPLQAAGTVERTPNLDRLAYEALRARADELDRRYPSR